MTDEEEKKKGIKRTIEVPYVKVGMELAKSAVTNTNQILFTTGTKFNEGKIKILRKSYIRHIQIWDAGQWDLPEDAYKPIEGEDTDPANLIAVDALVSHAQEVFNGVSRQKRVDVNALQENSNMMMQRLTDEPVFKIMLSVQNAKYYLFGHMTNLGLLSICAGRALGLDSNALWHLFVGAMLADIGMMQVGDEVWNSNKELTSTRRAEIEKHCEFGYNTIRKARDSEDIWALPALEHHERLDGEGYPDRKDASEISLNSKIVAVCDVYEAMFATRPWKEGKLPDLAMKELISKPEQLDRNIVIRLASAIGFYPVGYGVRLTDCREGEVVQANPKDPLRPVVQVGPDKVDLSQTEGLNIMTITFRPS